MVQSLGGEFTLSAGWNTGLAERSLLRLRHIAARRLRDVHHRGDGVCRIDRTSGIWRQIEEVAAVGSVTAGRRRS